MLTKIKSINQLNLKIMNTGIELILKERERQIKVEGYTLYEDRSKYENDELFNAATSYSAREGFRNENDQGIPSAWPWDAKWWKPTPDNRVRELEKAGALFMAHQEVTGFNCGGHIASCARRIDKIISKRN
jgi:hypothetical protein